MALKSLMGFVLLLAPIPPNAPTTLVQSRVPGGDPQAVGFVDDDRLVAFRATLFHPLGAGTTVQLEVEVKPNGALFNGTGVLTGPAVSGSGGTSEVVATDLPDGPYHWRARTVDVGDERSDWVEFDPAGSPDFSVLATAPAPVAPVEPTGLIQASSPGGAARPVGFVDDDPQVAFRGLVSSTVTLVALQVEVKPLDTPFDGGGLLAGPFVSAAGMSEVVVNGLANGSYHWRARALTAQGGVSDWVEFDGAPGADFSIATPAPPPPPSPPPSPPPPDDGGVNQNAIVVEDDDDDDCGLLGMELVGFLALLALARRGRRGL